MLPPKRNFRPAKKQRLQNVTVEFTGCPGDKPTQAFPPEKTLDQPWLTIYAKSRSGRGPAAAPDNLQGPSGPSSLSATDAVNSEEGSRIAHHDDDDRTNSHYEHEGEHTRDASPAQSLNRIPSSFQSPTIIAAPSSRFSIISEQFRSLLPAPVSLPIARVLHHLMMPAPRNLLVTGATGKQGRALIETLLASSQPNTFNILALTRKASSPSALSLAKRASNIKVLEGNLNDSRAIFSAARKITSEPIWGVFGVTTPMGGKEEEQGKALVDAALEAGAQRFVFTGVERGGEKATDVPHFITKHNIERHLKQEAAAQGGKMSWTILRPVFFMDNLLPGFVSRVIATAWKSTLAGTNKKLQMVSVADIGYVAAQAFLKPDEFRDEAISLAGDELTYEEADEVFKSKTGTAMPTTYETMVNGMLWMIKDMGLMFKFFKEEGFSTDVPGLKKRFPEMKGFAEWLDSTAWAKE